ncbi:Telomerase Cajal body protein 1 [Actinomortierella ambigua]|nr:Telomerase Cajal body protein 1 [Actinomortierella ambigua]
MDLDQVEETLVPQAPTNGQPDDEFTALVQDYMAHAPSAPLVQEDAAMADLGQDSLDATTNMTDAEWHQTTQSYMVVEYDIESLGASDGATASPTRPSILSSTQDTFNSTVGQARLRIGVKDDGKMTNAHENNFFKSLKWSPDGSCLLSASNDNYLRIFALPSVPENGSVETSSESLLLEAGVVVREGEVIYDMCWYPAMTTQDPASCCFLSSSRDHPVHLWDAYTGEIRCSYTVVDHCEVNKAPTSLCFNLDGSKIYCGLNNMIEIFDTTRPGRDSTKRPTTPTRKSKKGQKGVISCLTFSPDGSGLYAAGSYQRSIGLYDSKTDRLELLLKDRDQYGRKKKYKSTSSPTPLGGITQLQFSPDGQYLYSASRQDPWIRCWDVRNTAEVLFWLERPGVTTNQRIAFDISPDGRYLTTGDAFGGVSFFDLSEPERERQAKSGEEEDDHGGEVASRVRYSFSAHEDIVSAAAFNPVYPILATSSGQRKYRLQNTSLSDTDSDSDYESESENSARGGKRDQAADGVAKGEEQIDNSLRMWSLPGQQVWYVDGQRWGLPTEHDIEPAPTIMAEESSISVTPGELIVQASHIGGPTSSDGTDPPL